MARCDIREVSESELQALLSLYAHLHADDAPLPSAALVQAVWQELLRDGRHVRLGGYVQGQLIASCVVAVIPNLTRGCRPYALVENVVTHAGHRGQGHGKAVLQEALRRCWARGCYKAMLMTGRKDASTLQFYASAGFDGDDKRAFIARPPG